jgi:hypothetical protein
MKKSQIIIILFFINLTLFFARTEAICQKADDPAIAEEIKSKLDKYKADYETIEKSIKEVSDVNDDLNSDLKKLNDKFENYSKIYFAAIEKNENLESTHDMCVDLQLKIEKKIKDLQTGGAKEQKKSDLKNKLQGFLADYAILKAQGDLFVKNENRDSLQLLKQGELLQQLNVKLDALCAENDEVINNDPDLKKLCASGKQIKESINKLYIKPSKDIWGIIMKIAIIFAMIFFAVMIYNIIKSKLMLKAVKKPKPNNTPEI